MADVISDRKALSRLIRFGLVYNLLEGVICIGAGLTAGSIVLLGFGLDSGIEAVAAFAALRFMRGTTAEEQEQRLSRLVGWTFVALAVYVALQSCVELMAGADAAPSPIGVLVTTLSLLVMPIIGFWKLRLARRLDSPGLVSEAKETIACSYLSLFAVLGVGIRYFGGPSWIDPAAALLMVPWLVREGLELRGATVFYEGYGHPDGHLSRPWLVSDRPGRHASSL